MIATPASCITWPLKYLRSPLSAQDAVQDAFTRVWQNRAELPAIDHFESWLTAVTRNLLINQLRKKIPAVSDTSPTDLGIIAQADQPAGHPIEIKELETLIRQAIHQLPPQQQQVYRLRQEENLPHKEIADRLGISYNTAREHMSKALKNIRAFLQTHYDPLVLLLLCLARDHKHIF